MSCILFIETSTKVCSVAVSEDNHIIYHKEDFDGPNQARILAPMVDDALSFADSHAIPLDYVAVSEGPGSYTGLRIGCSTAKGICYGRNVKLIAVPTLKVITVPLLLYRDDIEEDAMFCPMIAARRMEVYFAVYEGTGCGSRHIHRHSRGQANILLRQRSRKMQGRDKMPQRPFCFQHRAARQQHASVGQPCGTQRTL